MNRPCIANNADTFFFLKKRFIKKTLCTLLAMGGTIRIFAKLVEPTFLDGVNGDHVFCDKVPWGDLVQKIIFRASFPIYE